MNKKSTVLKIGGSLLYDDKLNLNFSVLKKVKSWYEKNREQNEKIVIVLGGGKLSRQMQKKVEGEIEDTRYLHEISMSLTQTNSIVVAGYLNDSDIFVPKKLGDAYEYLLEEGSKTMISGGLKIGWSTDMDCAIFADILQVDRVMKLSTIDYVYESDPTENPDAKPLKDLTWEQYFKLFGIVEGSQHIVNKSMPIDVICSQFCNRKGISFNISGGKRLEELDDITEIFQEGTYIHP